MWKLNFTLIGLLFFVNIQAQTVDVITGLNNPLDLLFDENVVYFIDENSVKRADVSEVNPTVETISMVLGGPGGLIRKDKMLYVTDFYEGQIWKIDISTDIPVAEILIDGLGTPNMLALHNDNLYYTDNGEKVIKKIDLTDPNPQAILLLSNLGNVIGIEIYEDDLFYSTINSSSIVKVDLTAPSPVLDTLFTSISWPVGLDACGSNIYISDRYGNQILKFNPTCGSLDLEVALAVVTDPRTTAVHDGFIYALEGEDLTNWRISKAPIVDNTCSVDIQTACNSFTWIDGITYTANNNTATFLYSNVDDCDSIVTLDLTINQVNTDVSLTGVDTLNAAVADASYQWLDCNNNFTPINGETNQTFVATTKGSYAVEIIQNDCVEISECVEVTLSDIDDQSLFNTLCIYPNPTTGQVSIDFGNLNNPEVAVYSALGELLVDYSTITDRKFNLELDKASGVYFIRVRVREASRAYRILKIKI